MTDNNSVPVVYNKAVAHLLFVKSTDVLRRFLHNGNKLGIDKTESLVNLILIYLQRGQLCLVKFFGIGKQSLVSVLSDLCNYVGNNILNVSGDIVPCKNFAVGNFSVVIYLNHYRSFLFMCFHLLFGLYLILYACNDFVNLFTLEIVCRLVGDEACADRQNFRLDLKVVFPESCTCFNDIDDHI